MTTVDLVLRPATIDDVPLLESWDRAPHVIAACTDDPTATTAFDGLSWPEELQLARDLGPDVWQILIAELVPAAPAPGPARRPIGVVQIIDPHREPTHYWGQITPGRRALDIWIGEVDALGSGWGTRMMTSVLDRICADPGVQEVVIDPLMSNERAHRFYRRLGFRDVGPRWFGPDHCLVMSLDPAARRAGAVPEVSR